MTIDVLLIMGLKTMLNWPNVLTISLSSFIALQIVAVFPIFVITLQAFIFMVLTIVYLSRAHEDR